MPAIFTKRAREAMHEKLLHSGFELISREGIRSLTVEEVAQRSGIAKGTFYNFFPSKEEFVYQVILSRRILICEILENLAEQAGGLVGRSAFQEWLQLMWKSDNNLYRQISSEDWEYIRERWPIERSFDEDIDHETSEWLFSKLTGVRNDVNWKVFANLQKMLALMNMNHAIIHADALDETTDAVIEKMCDMIFEQDERTIPHARSLPQHETSRTTTPISR